MGADAVPLERPELLKNSTDMLNDDCGITFFKISEKLKITPEMLSIITGLTIPQNTHSNVEPLFGG